MDIGGESTRPGAAPVSLDEEISRVIPVIEALNGVSTVPISIDTYKPEVMRQAIAAGADMVNDVRALQEPGALDVLVKSHVGICLMHMQGNPMTMQMSPHYEDVVIEVGQFLADRLQVCLNHGIAKNRIVLDPGFGFGKTREHNISLIQQLEKLHRIGLPLLVGLSRCV